LFECYWIVSVCHSRYSSLSCNNFGNQMVALICWPRELTAVLTTQSTTCYETDNYPLNYRQAVLKGRFLIELTSLFGFSTKLDGLNRKNPTHSTRIIYSTVHVIPPHHLHDTYCTTTTSYSTKTSSWGAFLRRSIHETELKITKTDSWF